MNIDLTRLIKGYINELPIDITINFDESYFKDTEIRKLSEVRVKGSISPVDDEAFAISINLSGEMILPCAVSLVDVNYPFDIKIDEIIDPNEEKNDDCLKIIDNTIDIMPIIWQNIVVEIPMRVVSPNLKDVKLEGDGWKLLTEEEKMTEIDPRLEKLKDLLDD